MDVLAGKLKTKGVLSRVVSSNCLTSALSTIQYSSKGSYSLDG